MKKEIKNKLDDAILNSILDIDTLTSGSKERTAAVEDLNKLYRLRLEEEKTEKEYKDKKAKLILDNEKLDSESNIKTQELLLKERDIELKVLEVNVKENQICCQDKGQKATIILGIITGIVLPTSQLIFYAVWMNRGFKFEETGAYSSTTFRGLFNRFKPGQ